MIEMTYHTFKLAVCGRRENSTFIVMVRITGKSTVAALAVVKIFLFCNWRE